MALLDEDDCTTQLGAVRIDVVDTQRAARRDLFAAAALAGLLGGRGGWPEGHTEEENYRAIARHAMGIGDALLTALDQPKGET